MGTPKRWVEPTTTSAPISPGGVSTVSARMSAIAIASAPVSCTVAKKSDQSLVAPIVSGY